MEKKEGLREGWRGGGVCLVFFGGFRDLVFCGDEVGDRAGEFLRYARPMLFAQFAELRPLLGPPVRTVFM